ncbi:60S ribosomal protein L18 [Asimina triloba]
MAAIPSSSLSFLGSSSSSFSSSRELFFRPKIPASKLLPSQLKIQAKAATRQENRAARHARIRKKVEGTPERPRLCVFRSNKHIYVQVIDDTKMHTLASASTVQKPISEEFDFSAGPTIDVAKRIGEVIAKACLEKGISKVAFDRGGYTYHGRVEALADAAREHGLQKVFSSMSQNLTEWDLFILVEFTVLHYQFYGHLVYFGPHDSKLGHFRLGVANSVNQEKVPNSESWDI